MGIDSASKGGTNIMAGCATTNSTFSLLASSTIALSGGPDKKFKEMLSVATECVKGYAARNKRPPEELIIFMLAVPGDQVNLLQENFCKPLEDDVNKSYSV